jgi:DNA repair protein RadC
MAETQGSGLRITDLPAAERPVNRIHEVGPASVSILELLACVLQTGDALDLARNIYQTVGGIDGLARADLATLEAIPGVGPARAARLKAALELGKRLAYSTPADRPQITSPHSGSQVLIPMIGHEEQEHFVVLYLDTRNRVIDKEVLYRGTLNTSVVRTAEVFRGAVRRNCASIIVAHNHPSGDPNPSPEDIALTRRLVEVGRMMEVDVLDHLIIGGNRFISLRERGMGFED